MADKADRNEPAGREAIALELLRIIARNEGKMSNREIQADREWTLRTYSECLQATTNPNWLAPFARMTEKYNSSASD